MLETIMLMKTLVKDLSLACEESVEWRERDAASTTGTVSDKAQGQKDAKAAKTKKMPTPKGSLLVNNGEGQAQGDAEIGIETRTRAKAEQEHFEVNQTAANLPAVRKASASINQVVDFSNDQANLSVWARLASLRGPIGSHVRDASLQLYNNCTHLKKPRSSDIRGRIQQG